MKYQKSMIKIMEHLLKNSQREFTIETLITTTGSGRNTSFEALQWLEERGFVSIKTFGRQKLVRLNLDNYSLQYKYFLDALLIKALPQKTKTIVLYLSQQLAKVPHIKTAVLFGSAAVSEAYNDIDILLITTEKSNEKLIHNLRERVESVFNVAINIHYTDEEPIKVFEGIVIYQSSYFHFTTALKQQFEEYIEWVYSATLQQTDKQFVRETFQKAKLNLAFCHALLEGKEHLTKKEALSYFTKSYHLTSWKTLQEAGINLGKRIYR